MAGTRRPSVRPSTPGSRSNSRPTTPKAEDGPKGDTKDGQVASAKGDSGKKSFGAKRSLGLLTLDNPLRASVLKVVTTNICGSDQHMVRGRTSLTGGYMVLGHEITGEVVECGKDVEFVQNGDLCSVPFSIACGRCLPSLPLRL